MTLARTVVKTVDDEMLPKPIKLRLFKTREKGWKDTDNADKDTVFFFCFPDRCRCGPFFITDTPDTDT